jgi:hypothetical protein
VDAMNERRGREGDERQCIGGSWRDDDVRASEETWSRAEDLHLIEAAAGVGGLGRLLWLAC